MKQFPKPIRQCLVTAVATSTLLEAHALPLLSATAAEIPPAPTTDTAEAGGLATQASAKPAVSSQSTPTPPVPVTPQLIEAAQNYTNATPLTVPSGLSTADLNVPAISEGAAPAGASGNTALPAPIPSASEAPAAPAAAPVPVTSPAAPASPPTNSTDAVGAARQNLEKRLAAIVERDKSSREVQLRQNLINAALQQAQVGEFDRARQIAQHPALPPELQADTLTQIAAIEAQRSGQPQPVTAQAQPAAQPSTPTATAAAPSVPTDAAPGYWVAPQAPERINTYLSDRCLSQTPAPTAAVAPPTAPKPADAVIARLTQQSAASLVQFNRAVSAGEQLAQAPLGQRPTPSPELDQSGDRNPANLAQMVPPSLGPDNLARRQAQPQQPPLLSAEAPASESSLERMVESALAKPLKQVGVALPLAIPVAVKSMFGEWIDLTSGNLRFEVASGSGAGAASLSAVLPAKAKLLARDPYMVRMKQQIAELPKPSLAAQKSVAAQRSLTAQKTVAPKSSLLPALAKSAAAQEPAQLADYRRVLSINCSEFQNGSEPVSYEIDPALSKQQGWRSMMFPLPIPAVVTSLFGWRDHPIFGDRRFHTGLDIGAAMGTPVLAALAGRVVAADYMGGYGLAVVIETAAGSFRNLYGHLSAVAVRPGAWVEQGTVLGLVGSTGNSTGPHLHFETQVLEEGTWTAIDPLAAAAVSIAQAKATP